LSTERIYATKRQSIAEGLCTALKTIDGTGTHNTTLDNNVHPILKFWDEITEFPAVHINTGTETREYQGAGYKDRFLEVTIRCYIHEEDAAKALGALLEDVETVLEENSSLVYYDTLGAKQCAHQITILRIDTDEGVLEPIGVAEISIEVHY